MSVALEEIVRLIDEEIATLDATDFVLSTRASGQDVAWHHSRAPFEETATAGGKQHLEYVVDVESVEEAGEARIGRAAGVWMNAQIVVSFDFRIHPNSQVADNRKAMTAAARVVSAVRRPQKWAPGLGVTYQRCIQRYEPQPTDQNLLITVRTAHLIRYPEAL